MRQLARHLLALHRLSEAAEPKSGFEKVKQMSVLLYSSVLLRRVFSCLCFCGVNRSGMVKAGATTSSPQGPPALCINKVLLGTQTSPSFTYCLWPLSQYND